MTGGSERRRSGAGGRHAATASDVGHVCDDRFLGRLSEGQDVPAKLEVMARRP